LQPRSIGPSADGPDRVLTLGLSEGMYVCTCIKPRGFCNDSAMQRKDPDLQVRFSDGTWKQPWKVRRTFHALELNPAPNFPILHASELHCFSYPYHASAMQILVNTSYTVHGNATSYLIPCSSLGVPFVDSFGSQRCSWLLLHHAPLDPVVAPQVHSGTYYIAQAAHWTIDDSLRMQSLPRAARRQHVRAGPARRN
jgi:hypothetical protein